eukprot:gene4788-biopygen9607
MGGRTIVVVFANGSVAAWGDPQYGGDTSTVAALLRGGVVGVASSFSAFAALLRSGDVVTWGAAARGGDASTVSHMLHGVVAITPSKGSFVAVTSRGAAVLWGAGSALASGTSGTRSGRVDRAPATACLSSGDGFVLLYANRTPDFLSRSGNDGAGRVADK